MATLNYPGGGSIAISPGQAITVEDPSATQIIKGVDGTYYYYFNGTTTSVTLTPYRPEGAEQCEVFPVEE